MARPSLTLGYVPGGTPAKWARTWAERHPEVPLQLRVVAA
ncbi:MAG: LysR family transcriptional regulator, partial [Mycobacterium sp.]